MNCLFVSSSKDGERTRVVPVTTTCVTVYHEPIQSVVPRERVTTETLSWDGKLQSDCVSTSTSIGRFTCPVQCGKSQLSCSLQTLFGFGCRLIRRVVVSWVGTGWKAYQPLNGSIAILVGFRYSVSIVLLLCVKSSRSRRYPSSTLDPRVPYVLKHSICRNRLGCRFDVGDRLSRMDRNGTNVLSGFWWLFSGPRVRDPVRVYGEGSCDQSLQSRSCSFSFGEHLPTRKGLVSEVYVSEQLSLVPEKIGYRPGRYVFYRALFSLGPTDGS